MTLEVGNDASATVGVGATFRWPRPRNEIAARTIGVASGEAGVGVPPLPSPGRLGGVLTRRLGRDGADALSRPPWSRATRFFDGGVSVRVTFDVDTLSAPALSPGGLCEIGDETWQS